MLKHGGPLHSLQILTDLGTFLCYQISQRMCNLPHGARGWHKFKNWNIGEPLNFAGCTEVEATWRMVQQQLGKPWLVTFVGPQQNVWRGD